MLKTMIASRKHRSGVESLPLHTGLYFLGNIPTYSSFLYTFWKLAEMFLRGSQVLPVTNKLSYTMIKSSLLLGIKSSLAVDPSL